MAVRKQKRMRRKPAGGKQRFMSRVNIRAISYAVLVASFLFFTVGVLFYVVFFDR